MKGYLTYNKIINLLTIYFYHNEWVEQTPDYVKEKYDRIFCCLPDRISIVDNKIIFPDTISNDAIKRFFVVLQAYRKKWNVDALSKDEIILLFTVSYISNGYLNPFYLEKRYCDLFTSFEFINEYSQITGLHELLRQSIRQLEIEKEKEFLPYKRVTKLLKIKRLIK